jgi:hypothetical protein
VLFLLRRTRFRAGAALAVSFAANGIAFAIWNTVLPAQRTVDSFAVRGRGLFNWIAVPSMVLFGLWSADEVPPRSRWLIRGLGAAAAAVMLGPEIAEARRHHLGLLAFGGVAIYPATALALVLLALSFVARPACSGAFAPW